MVKGKRTLEERIGIVLWLCVAFVVGYGVLCVIVAIWAWLVSVGVIDVSSLDSGCSNSVESSQSLWLFSKFILTSHKS